MGLCARAKGLTDETGFDCGYLTYGTFIFELIFQSTRPLRGATIITGYCADCVEFQSTRPLRGATPRLVLFLI